MTQEGNGFPEVSLLLPLSKSSIKTKAVNLKVAGAASLGTATNQVEGGKEVNEAAAIMVAASSPAIRGATPIFIGRCILKR